MSLRTADRYARALFEVAREQDLVDRVQEELDLLVETFSREEARRFLEHRLISPLEKERLLDKIYGEHLSEPLQGFLRLLLRKRREHLLREVRRLYGRLCDQHRGILQAEVITAVPLSGEQDKELQEKLSRVFRREVRLEKRQDSSILGGVVLRLGERVIDGSLQRKLLTLGEKMRQAEI